MKDKDYVDLAEVYSDHVIAEGSDSHGYNQGKGKHWKEYRKKVKEQNPELPRMRAKAKKEWEEADKAKKDKKNKKFKVKEGAAEDANNARWSDAGHEELTISDLVRTLAGDGSTPGLVDQYIAATQHTNDSPEYNKVWQALYSAVSDMSKAVEGGGNVGQMPGEDEDRSWQDEPGNYPPNSMGYR